MYKRFASCLLYQLLLALIILLTFNSGRCEEIEKTDFDLQLIYNYFYNLNSCELVDSLTDTVTQESKYNKRGAYDSIVKSDLCEMSLLNLLNADSANLYISVLVKWKSGLNELKDLDVITGSFWKDEYNVRIELGRLPSFASNENVVKVMKSNLIYTTDDFYNTSKIKKYGEFYLKTLSSDSVSFLFSLIDQTGDRFSTDVNYCKKMQLPNNGRMTINLDKVRVGEYVIVIKNVNGLNKNFVLSGVSILENIKNVYTINLDSLNRYGEEILLVTNIKK